MKDSMAEKIKEKWRGKRMHGQFPCNLDEKLVDNEVIFLAKFGNIKKEKESTTEAAISTNCFKNKSLKAEMTVNADYITMKKILTT